MRNVVFLCFIILFAPACAQTPQPPSRKHHAVRRGDDSSPQKMSIDNLKNQIDQLLTQMTAEKFKLREKATKAMRKLLRQSRDNRKVLLAYLQKRFAESEDPEVCHRIQGVLDLYLKPWKYFEKLRTLKGHDGEILSVAFSPDGKLLASGSRDDGWPTIRIWESYTGKCLRILKGHSGDIYSIAFSPQGDLLASVSRDGFILIWNPDTGKCLRAIMAHESPVTSVAFSLDGKMLAFASLDNTVKIWNPHTGKCIHTLKKHTDAVNLVAFSPDGKLLASGSYDETIRLWDFRTGECLRTINTGRTPHASIAFSPDGKLLASASPIFAEPVQIWDVHTGKKARELWADRICISSIAYSPDGKSLAGANEAIVIGAAMNGSGKLVLSKPDIHIWNPRTGEHLRVLKSHKGGAKAIVFSPDGMLLASGGRDKTVIIWGIPER